jgi:hypothetical protein
MTKLIGAFRDFEKAPKKGSLERHYSHYPWNIFPWPYYNYIISKTPGETWLGGCYMKIRLAAPFVSVCSSPWNGVTITSHRSHKSGLAC